MTMKFDDTILIIEDDEGMAELITDILHYPDKKIMHMKTGKEVKLWLSEHRPLLLLLDYSLPDMTASSLIDDLKANNIIIPPFIVTTGAGDERIAVNMMKKGARDYLIKDYQFLDVLPSVVKRVIRELETDLKLLEAQEALMDSEERYRILAANFPDVAVNLFDRSICYILADGQEYTKLNIDKITLTGKTFAEVFGSDVYSLLEPMFTMAFSGNVCNKEIEINGSFYSIHFVPITDSKGQVNTVMQLMQNITGRKRAEEERIKLESQMQHAQKLESLGLLAGGIAHDFNNLLMSIIGNAQLTLLDLPENSELCEYLQTIILVSKRASELTNQMLAYSGKGRFQIKKVDLGELVKEMSQMLEISISKKITLDFDFAPGLPAVEVDAMQIRQVVMNLIINASDAIEDKAGSISVSTGIMNCKRDYFSEAWLNEKLPEGLYVYLKVTDTGCGMDKTTVEKIFDPFFTTKFTGRGLGLAAVLGIVRSHNGAIKVNSCQGKGTAFTVLLPACETHYKEASESKEKKISSEPVSGNILLIDDEEEVRFIVKMFLKRLGFSVYLASNGREGIEIFHKYKDELDCVLLDLTMPHMSGEETLSEIRKSCKTLPVIIVSGYHEIDVAKRFNENGISGFIQKPYDLQDLGNKVREVISKK